MSEITRYDHSNDCGDVDGAEVLVDPDGAWVLADDHERVVRERDEKIAELEREIEKRKEWSANEGAIAASNLLRAERAEAENAQLRAELAKRVCEKHRDVSASGCLNECFVCETMEHNTQLGEALLRVQELETELAAERDKHCVLMGEYSTMRMELQMARAKSEERRALLVRINDLCVCAVSDLVDEIEAAIRDESKESEVTR